jgi:hypothetical protein
MEVLCADFVGDVVGNHNYLAPAGILRCPESEHPSNHAEGVVSWSTSNLREFVMLVKHEILHLQSDLGRAQGRISCTSLDLEVVQGFEKELGEVIDISGADKMRLVSLGLQ